MTSQAGDDSPVQESTTFGLGRVAQNMRMWQKLCAICIAFVVPIAVLLYYFNLSANKDIRFARKEQFGLDYNLGLRSLIEFSRPAYLAANAAKSPAQGSA